MWVIFSSPRTSEIEQRSFEDVKMTAPARQLRCRSDKVAAFVGTASAATEGANQSDWGGTFAVAAFAINADHEFRCDQRCQSTIDKLWGIICCLSLGLSTAAARPALASASDTEF
jgi:hypothetical protein